jgi:hypothetical protein
VNLSTSREEDIFHFSLKEPGSIQVKFDYPSEEGNYRWRVRLFGAGSDGKLQELQSKYNSDSSPSANITKTMYLDKSRLPAGDYYILVNISTYFSNGDYTITALSDISADVPAPWAKSEIEMAINMKLIPQNLQKFYTQKISRKDFCYLATNLICVKTSKSLDEILEIHNKKINPNIFSDTKDSTVLAANALGIVNGKGNNKFDPGGDITRQEAAVMLQRTATVLGFSSPNASPITFADRSSFASWAKDGIGFTSAIMDKTSGNRMMGGTGNNRFSPYDTYSRQEAFITMLRLFNALD